MDKSLRNLEGRGSTTTRFWWHGGVGKAQIQQRRRLSGMGVKETHNFMLLEKQYKMQKVKTTNYKQTIPRNYKTTPIEAGRLGSVAHNHRTYKNK